MDWPKRTIIIIIYIDKENSCTLNDGRTYEHVLSTHSLRDFILDRPKGTNFFFKKKKDKKNSCKLKERKFIQNYTLILY